jgi:exosortase/archaeosortase family protein
MSAHTALVALQVAAFWPVWAWYVKRLADPADEPWGVVALVLAAVCYARLPAGKRGEPRALLLPTLATFGYALAFPWVPPLVRAALAMIAVAALVAPLRRGLPVVAFSGLLTLSLPLVPTLQFYLGHPLRVMSARLAALLLAISGFPVIVEGTCLRLGGQVVAVDAPCSGVQMLWGALLLSSVLAVTLRLRGGQTLAVASAAVALVIGANGFRAATLFLPESGALVLPAWMHTAVGVVIFAAAGLLVMRAALALAPTEQHT